MPSERGAKRVFNVSNGKLEESSYFERSLSEDCFMYWVCAKGQTCIFDKLGPLYFLNNTSEKCLFKKLPILLQWFEILNRSI